MKKKHFFSPAFREVSSGYARSTPPFEESADCSFWWSYQRRHESDSWKGRKHTFFSFRSDQRRGTCFFPPRGSPQRDHRSSTSHFHTCAIAIEILLLNSSFRNSYFTLSSKILNNNLSRKLSRVTGNYYNYIVIYY